MPEIKPYLIVVGVDYSETSDLAVERALDLASEKARSDVHLVNVLPVYRAGFTPDGGVVSEIAGVPSVGDASAKLMTYAQQTLARRKERGKRTPERVVTHLRLDAPAWEVAQLAADLEADLVVVGTHGRRGISRLMLGSVAEATVRLAPCPVLVVREKAPPQAIPAIEPPCPRCVETRAASGGSEYWCEQHREHHGQRHTYHQGDRLSAETNLPLVVRS
jgi:nucleotide-binding universal stress UspA family protein